VDREPPSTEAVVPVEYIDAGDAVVLVCRVEIEVRGLEHSRKVVEWSAVWREQAGCHRSLGALGARRLLLTQGARLSPTFQHGPIAVIACALGLRLDSEYPPDRAVAASQRGSPSTTFP
jgi:hypothetical protein